MLDGLKCLYLGDELFVILRLSKAVEETVPGSNDSCTGGTDSDKLLQ